ncbi:AI-2E family transporter [Candidatus Parcubacteria bacterium]|nr:AI-2E family transporter [Patescibacteria group bacterium]MCG2686942.1 AI-2E family transporter [Candidatus Parcubacteria bacterium]
MINTSSQKAQTYFFIVLFLLGSILMFFVFSPFLNILILAIILSFSLSPFYEKIKSFLKYDWLAFSIIILFLIFFVILPLIFLSWQIFQEVQTLYIQMANNDTPYLEKTISFIEDPIKNFIPNFSINLSSYIGGIFNWIISNIGVLISSATQIFMDLVLIIITLFFLLKNNKKLKKMIIEFSPLEDKYDNLILDKLDMAINSIIKGSLLVAVIQGLLAGIGFWAFGIPSPTFWGAVTVVSSLVPGVGTAIVVVPAIIYLLLNSSFIAAFGLFIWGALIVGTIDQIMRPFLYKKGVSTHPLFILFSVLGGLVFFGPLGIIFGPIILSLYLTLLEIYQIFSKEKQSYS